LPAKLLGIKQLDRLVGMGVRIDAAGAIPPAALDPDHRAQSRAVYEGVMMDIRDVQ